ncbi:SNARE domain-containing protein [Ditylenchus destructor]|uniref:SNARE domain-containing protein n=1 Tax=Ditylenchus destructor TaxID=166010 RepID=A0AAD4RBJ7_9BILA|nr:SNARE domain-containing protein [Ditylenchus destructor]
MSELPRSFNSAARRRHNHHTFQVDLQGADSDHSTGHSLVNFGPSAGQNYLPNPVSDKNPSSKNRPVQSSSFSNFSSLISAPGQIWNSAQNSLQAFADQYTQSLEAPTQQSTFRPPQEPDFSDFSAPLIPVEMPFRDRTSEFRTVTKSCQLKYQANGHLNNKDERDKIVRNSIQFNQLARRIGRDLSLTCAKMEKLTQLAKKKSLFDDRAGEVEELSQIIKQDITGLNKQIANLQEVIKQRTIANHLRDHQNQDHSKLVVVGLQSKLANVSKNFQGVLEICTQNLKLKKSRREKFSQPASVPSNLPPSASNGHMGSVLLHDDAMASGSTSVTVDMDRLEQQRMQDQLSLIDENEAYHRDRYNAMENIESSIAELGTIFRQLASLVSEQGEMITRIDTNVEDTVMNVEAAHHELLRYFNNISRNRWLIIKVFGVLMAFFIFFVIFLT